MPVTSNFEGFDVAIDNLDGTETTVGSVTVHVYDATNALELDPIESDENGVVVDGSLPVAAGTVVRFRVENDGFGRAWYDEQTTT